MQLASEEDAPDSRDLLEREHIMKGMPETIKGKRVKPRKAAKKRLEP